MARPLRPGVNAQHVGPTEAVVRSHFCSLAWGKLALQDAIRVWARAAGVAGLEPASLLVSVPEEQCQRVLLWLFLSVRTDAWGRQAPLPALIWKVAAVCRA